MSQYGTFSVTLFMRQPFPIYVPNRRIPNAENCNSGVHMLVELKRRLLSSVGSLWGIIQMMFWNMSCTYCTVFVSKIGTSPLPYAEGFRVLSDSQTLYISFVRHTYEFYLLECKNVFAGIHLLLALQSERCQYWKNADIIRYVQYMMWIKWRLLLSGKQSSSLRFLVTDA